jgi:XTP/dITP diphosphohydrolase
MINDKVLIASSNKGKLREFGNMLGELGISVVSQGELGISDAVEDGISFVENAIKKARHACKESGLPAIADDSGLAVPALGGQPGIYSARYGGEHGNDKANNARLLQEMQTLRGTERNACFHCVLVFMLHSEDPTPVICHGRWEGRILDAERGSEGFGYDPLFFVESDQCSAAELSKERKAVLSHRGQALRALLQQLQSHVSTAL